MKFVITVTKNRILSFHGKQIELSVGVYNISVIGEEIKIIRKAG